MKLRDGTTRELSKTTKTVAVTGATGNLGAKLRRHFQGHRRSLGWSLGELGRHDDKLEALQVAGAAEASDAANHQGSGLKPRGSRALTSGLGSTGSA